MMMRRHLNGRLSLQTPRGRPAHPVRVDSSADDVRLRGLFIWAVTQDTDKNDLLDAVLQPDGLGKFKRRNGVHSDVDDWDTKSPDKCQFSGKFLGTQL